uniref:Serpentine receptor class gamma n=1 Tax=Plectus sambesii TaxID=2011161 RepID=A0A914VC16_9BILA
MLNVWISIKFRQMGFFFDFYAKLDPFLARFGSYMTWLMLYMQIAGITIISVNRFSMIVFPLRSIKFWTKRMEYIFITAAYTIPILLSYPAWEYTNITFYRINGTNDGVALTILTPNGMYWVRISLVIVGLAVSIGQILLYGIMFGKGYAHHRDMVRKRTLNPNHRDRPFTAHINLAITGFVMSIALLGTVVLEYLASFNNDFNVFFYFYKVAFDFFNEFNPYLLLATCSRLREKHLAMFGIKMTSKATSTHVDKSKYDSNAQSQFHNTPKRSQVAPAQIIYSV